MTRRFATVLLCVCGGSGCAGFNTQVSCLPVYTTPAGFSETYHAALKRQEPLLWAVGEGVPVGFAVEGPAFPATAAGMNPAARLGGPPIKW